MKKTFLLLLSVCYFFMSCGADDSTLDQKPIIVESVEGNNQVFFTGEGEKEILSSKTYKTLSRTFKCGVTGSDCARPNEKLTYVYTGSNRVKWTVNRGDISIFRGQGTNEVTLSFGSNFTGGFVTAENSESPSCKVIFEILKCGTIPNPDNCGIKVGSIVDLNVFGKGEVIFYPVTELKPRWTIESSLFKVIYKDGSISRYKGGINGLGYPQIKIPVSCSNKVVEVIVDVNVKNTSSNVKCSVQSVKKWTVGVCGTSGGGLN